VERADPHGNASVNALVSLPVHKDEGMYILYNPFGNRGFTFDQILYVVISVLVANRFQVVFQRLSTNGKTFLQHKRGFFKRERTALNRV
jgi:hypothetical protein